MDRTAVVAIGGNALSPAGEAATVANQFRHTRESLAPIVEFACQGWNIAVVHGNGPQVGDELVRNEKARDALPELPLGVLVASTAGWIGYMIQQSLQNALVRAGARRNVVTLMTQVLVEPTHASVLEPRKFIGRAIDEELARSLRRQGMRVERDGHGNLRRKVASPEPLEIVEAPVIAHLVARGDIVIAAGGGGSPVSWAKGGLEGIDAVVDKDLAASILAQAIGASCLMILTDVDGVYRDYGGPAARRIERLNAAEARQLLAGEELGIGSMRPKLEAAADFVESGGERAVIAALADAAAAAKGRAGTLIVS
ncbi:MAG: carbamate kinase [Gemmatimonadota bacterium]